MNNRIVIIYLGDFFYDARSINMCISLLKKNYLVSVISTDKKKLPNSQIKNVNFYFINLINQNYKKYFEFFRKVNNVLESCVFDIVIAGDIYSLASASKYKNKKKLIYDCREIYTQLAAHEKRGLVRFYISLYERFFLKYVDQSIVTAKTDLDYLQNKYSQYKNCSWSIIYNYPSLFSKIKPINIRKEFQLPDKNILIVYQGVLQRGRGIKQLLLLSSLVPKISAVIIGGGKSQEQYIKLSKKLNVNDKTVFIKKIPYYNLINYTSACDVGWAVIKSLGVSNVFSLPNKLFEYCLAGLPVIGSSLPNIKYIIEKHELGSIVSENNTLEQIQAIDVLLKNKKQKKYYRDKAIQNFTWECQEKKFLQIINE